MSEKPYHLMNDEELEAARAHWTENCADAVGWPSAYFSARQLESICRTGRERGFDWQPAYRIAVG